MNETQKTKFWYQLRSFGLKRIIVSTEFFISLAVFIAMVVDSSYWLNIFSKSQVIIIAIFAAAATLFAITLAALAIILSFSSSEFVSFLNKTRVFSKILFQFWLGNGAFLLVLLLCITYFIFNLQNFPKLEEYLYPAIVALFSYATINSFYILGAVIRFGYFLGIYENIRSGKTKDKN